MIEEFRKAFTERYERLRRRKDEGQKIVGWTCTYVPEEIIAACGLLPIRVMGTGSDDVPIATAHLYSNVCFFVRGCLEGGFQGKYDFLDGLIVINACDHMRRLYDAWAAFLDNPPYKHMLGVPCKISADTLEFFRKDIDRFKGELETAFGRKISEEDLRHSITLFNRTRSLLQELYELKKADPPPISGAETLEVVLAGLVMPKEEYNVMLENLLKELHAGSGAQSSSGDGAVRLMISGSELDDADHLRLIESCGASVVIDDICNGTRYFSALVDENAVDPLEALTRRYLEARIPCARMRPQQLRVDILQKLAQEYKIDGLIYENIKFCGPYGGVYPIIRRAFKELDIPVLNLQRDYSGGGAGQLKTRVQAFLEQIGG